MNTSEFWTPIVTTLINTLIVVLIPIIVTSLPYIVFQSVKWINAQLQIVKSKMTTEQYNALYSIVSTLVHSAEQSGSIGVMVNTGVEKKAYVLGQAQKYLNAHGIKVNVSETDDMIEKVFKTEIKDKIQIPAPDATTTPTAIVTPTTPVINFTPIVATPQLSTDEEAKILINFLLPLIKTALETSAQTQG